MEYANNQLKAIAEWPNVQCQDASTTCFEFVRQLQGILELSRFDKAHCICLLMHNVNDMKASLDVLDDMKLDCSTVIVQDNS